ncbi:MAG: class I tRNA ligase family protein, partial [Planctomycetia bacterium]|nr:class I tRNA ligase family protein [Planctomycetia bacterium]
QGVLLHVLDSLLRLLHPMIPFVTEEVWQRLADFAPQRGLVPQKATASITVAPWPMADETAIDSVIEDRFSLFQELLRAVREIRARQNVPPKTQIRFSVRCEPEVAELLAPMAAYLKSMAGAVAEAWGPEVVAPALSANAPTAKMEVFVDLAELIDVDSEIAKKKKDLEKLAGLIKGKEAKLAGGFVQKAPPQVVEKERQSLEDLKGQYEANDQMLRNLETIAANRQK